MESPEEWALRQGWESQERLKNLALLLARRNAPQPRRGRREHPLKAIIVAEAEGRRARGEPASASFLLRWAKIKFGKKAPRSDRTIRYWISPQRQ
jgi:hypothetical protein